MALDLSNPNSRRKPIQQQQSYIPESNDNFMPDPSLNRPEINQYLDQPFNGYREQQYKKPLAPLTEANDNYMENMQNAMNLMQQGGAQPSMDMILANRKKTEQAAKLFSADDNVIVTHDNGQQATIDTNDEFAGIKNAYANILKVIDTLSEVEYWVPTTLEAKTRAKIINVLGITGKKFIPALTSYAETIEKLIP